MTSHFFANNRSRSQFNRTLPLVSWLGTLLYQCNSGGKQSQEWGSQPTGETLEMNHFRPVMRSLDLFWNKIYWRILLNASSHWAILISIWWDFPQPSEKLSFQNWRRGTAVHLTILSTRRVIRFPLTFMALGLIAYKMLTWRGRLTLWKWT